MRLRLVAVLGALFASACHGGRVAAPDPLAAVAQQYVSLVAALSQRDADAVTNDTAPAPHAPVAAGAAPSFEAVAMGARQALDQLAHVDHNDPALDARAQWLRAQLAAVEARSTQRAGTALPLDAELRDFYGARRPSPDALTGLESVRSALDGLLPGSGPRAARLDDFESSAVVPGPRVAAVFERAFNECRDRTRSRLTLPAGESTTVKYVVGESWAGFSAYEGRGHSLVSVNTGYPQTVDRLLQLACHEGYPGHHVINLLRDAQADAGRPELRAVPLFSPEAYQTEALATRATSLVFTNEERAAFERDVLFPLAGLPADEATRHVRVAMLVEQLAPAIGDALARYLAGERNFVETSWALQEDALMRHPEATIAFARQYGAFALAYAGAPAAGASAAPAWLAASGFPAGPVMISEDGHHSSASSHGR